jgi:hypothetical protein
VRQLRDELARPRDDAPSRILAERLGAELRRKDERLRKLDAAVKTIQGELTGALKKVSGHHHLRRRTATSRRL